MSSLLLAVAAEIVFLAAGIAVLMLLVFQLRLQQRFRTMDLEVARLKKAHQDGTLDARSRLEEASKALEALEDTVAPRLEALEPHLADVGSRLDELEERVLKVAPVVEAAEKRGEDAAEAYAEARTWIAEAEEVVKGAGERFAELEESIRDARGRVSEAEGGLDHLRDTVGRRLDAIQVDLAELAGTVTGPAPRTVAPAPEHPAPKAEASEDGEERTEAQRRGLGLKGALVAALALAGILLVLRWLVLRGS